MWSFYLLHTNVTIVVNNTCTWVSVYNVDSFVFFFLLLFLWIVYWEVLFFFSSSQFSPRWLEGTFLCFFLHVFNCSLIYPFNHGTNHFVLLAYHFCWCVIFCLWLCHYCCHFAEKPAIPWRQTHLWARQGLCRSLVWRLIFNGSSLLRTSFFQHTEEI